MTMTLPQRTESFEVDRAGDLVRKVVPKRGKPYQHTCTLESYEAVAHAAEELGQLEGGFTVDDLAEAAEVPMTQAAVALAFFKERGFITTHRKHNYADEGLHLDAMIEFHALREEPAPQRPQPPATDKPSE